MRTMWYPIKAVMPINPFILSFLLQPHALSAAYTTHHVKLRNATVHTTLPVKNNGSDSKPSSYFKPTSQDKVQLGFQADVDIFLLQNVSSSGTTNVSSLQSAKASSIVTITSSSLSRVVGTRKTASF